jgi:hypothetical protein
MHRRSCLIFFGFLLLGCGGGGTEGSPPVPPRQVALAVAGDIASSNTGDSQTAALIEDSIDYVLAVGDTAYEDGSLAEFQTFYEPTWGRFKSKTRPVPGNHEYHTSGAAGYFSYFGALAGPTGKGFYSFDAGAWHIVCLNTEIDQQEQLAWLRQDLSSTSKTAILASFHRPLFNSGSEHAAEDTSKMLALWKVLEQYGADVVVNGHEHSYQRYRPQTSAGIADAHGIREFVVGTGGRELHPLGTPAPGLEFAEDDQLGILKVTLSADSYHWSFETTTGEILDSGNQIVE